MFTEKFNLIQVISLLLNENYFYLMRKIGLDPPYANPGQSFLFVVYLNQQNLLLLIAKIF